MPATRSAMLALPRAIILRLALRGRLSPRGAPRGDRPRPPAFRSCGLGGPINSATRAAQLFVATASGPPDRPRLIPIRRDRGAVGATGCRSRRLARQGYGALVLLRRGREILIFRRRYIPRLSGQAATFRSGGPGVSRTT